MATMWRSVLVVAMIVAALVMPPRAPAGAQPLDCAATTWVAADTLDYVDALQCWSDPTLAPGDYMIELTGDVAAFDFAARSSEFSLTIDGGGNLVEGQAVVAGPDPTAPVESLSPITIRNATFVADTTDVLALFGIPVTMVDVELTGALFASGDVTLQRAHVHDVEGSFGLRVSGRAVILDSAFENNRDGPALQVEGGAVLVRNSIFRGNNGAVDMYVENSEIAITESALIDNDVNVQSGYGVIPNPTSIISIINSTVIGHDAHSPGLNFGVGGEPLTQVANSTIVDNGRNDIVGNVVASSSIVGRCEGISSNHPLFFPIPLPSPTDGGANVGSCFGAEATAHYPPMDLGCVTPTPIGCVPVVPTAPGSAARASGNCDSTVILDPSFDLFAFDVTSIDPITPTSAMTTIGEQTIDQRGFARTSCDVGAIDTGTAVDVAPPQLRVLSWDIDEPLCCGYQPGFADARTAAIADVLDAIAPPDRPDVIMLQRALRHPSELSNGSDDVVEDLLDELAGRSYELVYDFAPNDGVEPDEATTMYGQVVMTRLPILEKSVHDVAVPDPDDDRRSIIQEVVLGRPDEPIRVVNFRTIDGAVACEQVNALSDWLDAQPDMTTIVGGGFGVNRNAACYAGLLDRWIDVCTAVAATCEPTIDPIVDTSQPTTRGYVLLRPAAASVATVVDAGVMLNANAAETISAHLPLFATLGFTATELPDVDGDGVTDAADNCPTEPNADQADTDGDSTGDECEPTQVGDANCDGTRNIVDALFIAQLEVGRRTASPSCPLGDPATEAAVDRGDTDGNGSANIVDALRIMRCEVGLDDFVCLDD